MRGMGRHALKNCRQTACASDVAHRASGGSTEQVNIYVGLTNPIVVQSSAGEANVGAIGTVHDILLEGRHHFGRRWALRSRSCRGLHIHQGIVAGHGNLRIQPP